MSLNKNYQDKFEQIAGQTLFPRLSGAQQRVVRKLAECYGFTFQELRQVAEIALDLEMWGEGGLDSKLALFSGSNRDSTAKKRLLDRIQLHREKLRAAPNCYPTQAHQAGERARVKVLFREKPKLGLGHCPVASPRTRCCNLLTLDAVENCGYQCSYCSIQSFYTGNQVYFDPAFVEKLASLDLDPDRVYHIGTGQSSDSLMWGNSKGVLDSLIDFAQRHPNVILELKTKSANVGHLLEQDLPANLLCTWSLNTQPIIEHEERGSASLQARLGAARQMAESGNAVGFHFHPMIHYQDWEQDYGQLFESVQEMFSPEQVVMASFGTLTFIKPVMRRIRESGIKSQILKHQLVDAEGKLSYPDEIKLALFSFAYRSFRESWKRSVFFYLCMEHHKYWRPVFGFEYSSNAVLEDAMKSSYMDKINRLRAIRQ